MTNKLRYALSASLSVALAYLFPLYFGISDSSTAAITVMIIAASDSLSSSISKGFFRVIGTIIGAILGITLIALFPQDRFLYLFILSLFVAFILYLARAYRGDKTIFTLSAITMMVVFDGGEVDDIFLYAANKTMLTIIGIMIYTFVSVYIIPQKTISSSLKSQNYFVWFVKEDIKGAFVSFLVFWVGILLWIYLEIPSGYLIAALATAISVFTVYSVAKGSQVFIIFCISLIFAAISYIFVLPHLDGWWSLGIFLFIYSFLGFYFIPQAIVIFYLMGMVTFMIQNEMIFSIELFMFVLLIFYMFLLILLFFDYFPFDQRSEYLFLELKDRYLSYLQKGKFDTKTKETLEFMKLHAKKIDFEYFGVKKEDIENFCKVADEVYNSKNVKKLYNINIDFEKLKESKF